MIAKSWNKKLSARSNFEKFGLVLKANKIQALDYEDNCSKVRFKFILLQNINQI